MKLYMLTNTQIAHGSQANSVRTNSYPVLLICACVSEGLDTLHCIASSSRKHAKESSYFLFGMEHSPSLLYSNISYFLNYAMLDRKNGLSRKDSCTYTFVFFISNVESKTGTLEQQSRFALECDILFSPLSQLLNFPRVQSLLDRKYGHMDFFNVSPTFPYLLTSCCLHLQCRIEYIGLRSKKSGFSPHTLEVPLTTFIRNVQAT